MLYEKLSKGSDKIVLYGLTPPKKTNSQEQILEIAQTQIDRLKHVELDGLVVYDLQDEADRTQIKRPFPFLETIDPTLYAKEYLKELGLKSVIYRAVSKYEESQTKQWLEECSQKDVSIFVGASSKNQSVKFGISQAYNLKKEVNPDMLLGGIAISERHMSKHDEHIRVANKIKNGCKFFITQAVYDLDASIKFLDDYHSFSKEQGIDFVPIIFTLTPCGSKKTLEFMKWLGIYISSHVEENLLNSDNMLESSLFHIQSVFEKLYVHGRSLGIPIGCNIESVAIRKEEIEASIELVDKVKSILNKA